jgi:hypothetical protein
MCARMSDLARAGTRLGRGSRFLGRSGGFGGGGFGRNGAGLGGELLALVIIEAAFAFLNFIRLLSHKSQDLLRETDAESSLHLGSVLI